MKWFSNSIRTMEELRREYRRLAKLHHPDVGGNTEDAKEINNEYSRLFDVLSRQEAQERPQGEQEYKDTTEDKAAEDKAINVPWYVCYPPWVAHSVLTLSSGRMRCAHSAER